MQIDGDGRTPVGPARRAGLRRQLLLSRSGLLSLAATVTLGLTVAACGSSSSSNTTSAASSTTSASSGSSGSTGSSTASSGGASTYGLNIPSISPAALQKTLQQVFGANVPASSLPQVAQDAFKMASEPVTPAQTALVEKCLTETVCQTGVKGGVSVADLEANGAVNPFRQLLRAIVDLQAIRSGKVSTLIYSDANGSLQTFLSNYRTLISQKVKIITGTFDFGPSMLPLTRQAAAAGLLVVPVSTTIPNVTGHGDIAFDVKTNLCQYGQNLGEKGVLGQTSGTIAMFTGTPGNNFGAEWMPCAQAVIKKAGLQYTSGNTDWSPQGEVQAASALASSGKDVKSIVYDYLPDNFFREYLKLGKNPPNQAGGNAAFSTVPLWKKIVAKDPSFKFYVAPSQLAYSYVSVTGALEKLGGNNNIPLHVVLPNPLVSMTAILPQYVPSLPATMEFGSLLPNAIAAKALSNVK
jgi:ABC-type sugar transport system substrate-binding protein